MFPCFSFAPAPPLTISPITPSAEQREQAQQLLRLRYRRGAVAGAEHGGGAASMARLRMRKVLMVVKVVSAWRDLAGRLLLPPSRRSSRLSQQSATSASGADGDDREEPPDADSLSLQAFRQHGPFAHRGSLVVPLLLPACRPRTDMPSQSSLVHSLACNCFVCFLCHSLCFVLCLMLRLPPSFFLSALGGLF